MTSRMRKTRRNTAYKEREKIITKHVQELDLAEIEKGVQKELDYWTTNYMHTVSGDVATAEEWKNDFDNMDVESWFGDEYEECKDKHWLNDQKYLVEVEKVNGEWEEVAA